MSPSVMESTDLMPLHLLPNIFSTLLPLLLPVLLVLLLPLVHAGPRVIVKKLKAEAETLQSLLLLLRRLSVLPRARLPSTLRDSSAMKNIQRRVPPLTVVEMEKLESLFLLLLLLLFCMSLARKKGLQNLLVNALATQTIIEVLTGLFILRGRMLTESVKRLRGIKRSARMGKNPNKERRKRKARKRRRRERTGLPTRTQEGL